MSNRLRTQLVYSALAGVLAIVLFVLLQNTTNWPWYFTWPIAAGVAFVFYGVDKGLSKANAARVPEATLHVLALAGGFAGALLGMLAFHHKSNFRAHPLFLPVIILGAALWGALLYTLLR
ncbi:DUF1294 domain-containing protein [Promineifilum sp.]|uniref:DUF1294 domain-containing protein n=1 Tax=Promineifilum sp. TaxID=2664178 RepID=UPI0035B19B84